MDLAFNISAFFQLITSGKSLAYPDFSFEYKRLHVTGQLLTGEPIHEGVDDHEWYSRDCFGIEIVLKDIQREQKLLEAVQKDEDEEAASVIVHFCVEAANRLLIAMKNLGEIATADPIFKDKQRPAKNKLLNLRLVDENLVEKPISLYQVGQYDDFIFPFTETVWEESWLRARFGVISDARIPRETEFLVNAKRHVRLGNYRYAVLEAAIGLEMIVNEYIETELATRPPGSDLTNSHREPSELKRMSEVFLRSPSFDLSAKLNALLPMLTWSKLYAELHPESLRILYGYRSKLMHEGLLPTDATPQKVTELVEHCREACDILRRQIDRKSMGGDLHHISENVGKAYPTTAMSMIRYEGKGYYYGYFEFIGDHFLLRAEIPPVAELNKIIAIVSDGIMKQCVRLSPQFEPGLHLFVVFKGLEKKAIWQGGRLDVTSIEDGDFGTLRLK